MKRTSTLGGLALLGLGLATGGACVGTGDESLGQNPSEESTAFPSPAAGASSPSVASVGSGAIDVTQDSRVSLGLRGGLGPIVEGQSITKAMVSLQDMELVGEDGTPVSLLSDGVTTDLLALENSLQSLAQDQAIHAGRYAGLRFRLTSAWIQTVDAQNATHIFASQGVDQSQFASVGSVSQLKLSGIGPDGFVSVALPQNGIAVQGSASLAVQFALAESLSVQSSDTWVLAPRVWAVDASEFSSLDVRVTSVQQVGSGRFDVRTDDHASFTEQTRQGQVIAQTNQPVGPIDQVAPRTGSREPVRPGEQPPAAAPPPKIPGLPGGGLGGAPNTMPGEPGRGRPSVEDAGGPPSGRGAGRAPQGFDTGGPPGEPGAGRPSGRDAGGLPGEDAGVRLRPPQFDAGARQPPSGPVPGPPRFDAGAPTTGYGTSRGAGAPPAPRQPAGSPPAGSVLRQPAGSPPARSVPRPPEGSPPASSTAAESQPHPSVDAGAPSGRTPRSRGVASADLE